MKILKTQPPKPFSLRAIDSFMDFLRYKLGLKIFFEVAAEWNWEFSIQKVVFKKMSIPYNIELLKYNAELSTVLGPDVKYSCWKLNFMRYY